jgi:hypothetical protein
MSDESQDEQAPAHPLQRHYAPNPRLREQLIAAGALKPHQGEWQRSEFTPWHNVDGLPVFRLQREQR